MHVRYVYLKLPFIGAVFIGQRYYRRPGQFLEHDRDESGELCLWVTPWLDVIWTPPAAEAAIKARFAEKMRAEVGERLPS